MDQQPDIILLGYGVDDTLQLTVEAQRVLARVGFAYTLGAPPNLQRFLKAQRIDCIDLSGRFDPGKPYSECYLDIAGVVLKRAGEDPPAVLLSQGNPLFLNSLNRFLVMQAREREMTVQTLPGVSPFDAIVSDLGLDVGAFGLQLFDARRLVAREQQVNPAIPLLVLQVGAFGSDRVAAAAEGTDITALEPFATYLRRFYPPEHAVTLVNTAGGGDRGGRSTVPLSRFGDLVPHISSASSLFVDALRPARTHTDGG